MAMNVVKAGGGGGGRRGRRRRAGAPMAEINVTPFVDVMLVLLIIFMVSAPLLTPGVEVRLPTASANQGLPQPSQPPVPVTIDAQGGLFYGQDPVSFPVLAQRLRAAREEGGADRVYLRADGSVPYTQIAVLMSELTAAGFPNLGFIMSSEVDAARRALLEQGGAALDDAPVTVDVAIPEGFNAPTGE